MMPTGLVRPLSLTLLLALAAFTAVEGSALAAKHANGKPSVKAGEPEAAWLWFDTTGWHFRGSAGKTRHTFVGYLRSGAGVSGVKPTRSGLMKKMELEPEGVRFEFEIGGPPSGSVEGFDWQQSGDECVTVELKIDGKQQPSRFFVGLRSESPELFPLLACRE